MASILISEADPDVRRLLSVLLERLGHEAIVLGDGAGTPPRADVLLLEPASRGCLDQARAVCSLDPGIAIVAVSAFPDELEPLTTGKTVQLTKPFTIDQLAGVIEDVLVSPAR